MPKFVNELVTRACILFGVEMLKGFLKLCVFAERLSVTQSCIGLLW